MRIGCVLALWSLPLLAHADPDEMETASDVGATDAGEATETEAGVEPSAESAAEGAPLEARPRAPLPPASEDGLTDAPDEEGSGSNDIEPSSSPSEAYESSASPDTPEYGQGVSGKIEDGRRFVWAAYGVSWAVLLLFTLSVFRRLRAQLDTEARR